MFATKKQVELSSKRQEIAAACRDSNTTKLVDLADAEGGLLDDALRATACKYSIPAETNMAKAAAQGHSC